MADRAHAGDVVGMPTALPRPAVAALHLAHGDVVLVVEGVAAFLLRGAVIGVGAPSTFSLR
jgi:hypothetical protein